MKKNGFEKRKNLLSEIISLIFGFKLVSYNDTGDNCGDIILGGKNEINDCTFTEKYKIKFYKLFEIALVYNKCNFYFINEKKNSIKNFDRSDVTANAIIFFKLYDIDLDYRFACESENILFQRLIYRLLIKLLESLFTEELDNSTEMDEKCKKVFYKNLNIIKKYVQERDIIECLYDKVSVLDIESFYDSDYEVNDCNDICLQFLDPRKHYELSNSPNRIIGINIQTRFDSYINSIETVNRYNVKKYKLMHSKFSSKIFVKILNETATYNFPHYCCLKTDLSSLIQTMDEKRYNIFKDRRYENIEALEENIYSKIYKYVCKNYTQCHEDDYINQLMNINHALEIILQINYDTFFNGNDLPDDLTQSFFSFQKKTNTIMGKDGQLVFFKYLFSRWVENVFYVIRYLDYDNASENINKDDAIYKKIKKRIKEHSYIQNFDNAAKYYEIFLKKNKAVIDEYNWIICDQCDSPEEMIAKSQKNLYNPYNNLKEYYHSFRCKLDLT